MDLWNLARRFGRGGIYPSFGPAKRGAARLRETLQDAQIAGNFSGLRQILLNLACNALRHTPLGGQIDISAGIEVGEIGRSAVIEFADTGCGLSRRICRIFSRWDSLHRQTPGLVLRLPANVEQHRGTIKVQADGTRHDVPYGVSGPMTELVNRQGIGQTAKSVLVVDDEPGMRMALRTNFQRAGWDVEVAGEVQSLAQAGISALSAGGHRLRMPDGDGLQLMRSLQSSSPSTAVMY